MPHLDAITIHSRRPIELARFWSELLGLPIDPTDARAIEQGTLGETEAVLLGRREALHVWVSPAEELAPPGGRVHLDVVLDGPADLDRLTGMGAEPRWDDSRGRWRVYADPEGNLFCAATGWDTNGDGSPPATRVSAGAAPAAPHTRRGASSGRGRRPGSR